MTDENLWEQNEYGDDDRRRDRELHNGMDRGYGIVVLQLHSRQGGPQG